jgi:hypothetical protein
MPLFAHLLPHHTLLRWQSNDLPLLRVRYCYHRHVQLMHACVGVYACMHVCQTLFSSSKSFVNRCVLAHMRACIDACVRA